MGREVSQAGSGVVGVGVGAAVALCALTFATAPAGAQGTPLFTERQAIAQLQQATEALTGTDESLDVTSELRDLALALPALDPAQRRQARAILARPPSGEHNASDIRLGATWTPAATAGRQFYDSPGGQFRVHFVTSSSDAPNPADAGGVIGVPDYVELVAEFADDSEAVENDVLGWPAPKPDGARGDEVGPASGRTDVYLSDLASSSQDILYGYASPDDNSNQCEGPPFRCHAYLTLDNDYAEPEYGYGGDPTTPLSVTMAHEYNHVLQFKLDSNQDTWMFESTAVWAEEKVFPDEEDWVVTYMDLWARDSETPITKPVRRRFYGSGVWNHFLEAKYGADVILRAWELSRVTSPRDFAVDAYNEAIKEVSPGHGFPPIFTRFTAATSEWRSGVGNFPEAPNLPKVKRTGRLVPGASRTQLHLDNTAYRLIRVNPRSADDIKLRVTTPDGLRAGIALVGREGPVLNPVSVVRKVKHIRGNGSGSVKLSGAQDFDRITAVVVNADGRVIGSKPFRYRFDDQKLTAKLRRNP